jgi:hypothetical protein
VNRLGSAAEGRESAVETVADAVARGEDGGE